jgi:hypothetical protein
MQLAQLLHRFGNLDLMHASLFNARFLVSSCFLIASHTRTRINKLAQGSRSAADGRKKTWQTEDRR